jgi:hypothetical protein
VIFYRMERRTSFTSAHANAGITAHPAKMANIRSQNIGVILHTKWRINMRWELGVPRLATRSIHHWGRAVQRGVEAISE